MKDIALFPLLRRVGHTCRYEIPPRPSALRARRNAGVAERLAEARRRVPNFGRLLKSIRFSVPAAVVCGAVILFSEHALREQPGLISILLVVIAVVRAVVAG